MRLTNARLVIGVIYFPITVSVPNRLSIYIFISYRFQTPGESMNIKQLEVSQSATSKVRVKQTSTSVNLNERCPKPFPSAEAD
ncbi:hypothetical protein F4680DRAFT_415467 [Xylaria scruposa]|nr:hypothetical protein F4680DRAFT_415467 [Xylaria scruposa]